MEKTVVARLRGAIATKQLSREDAIAILLERGHSLAEASKAFCPCCNVKVHDVIDAQTGEVIFADMLPLFAHRAAYKWTMNTGRLHVVEPALDWSDSCY